MKKLFTVRALIFVGLISFPLFVSAAPVTELTQGFTTLGGIVDTLTQTVVKSLATLAATAAMVAFFFGVVKYVWGIRDGVPAEIEKGQKFMIWGLVALFVMFSVWGIVQYAQNIFGIKGQNTITIPSIEFKRGGSPSTQQPGGSVCSFQPDGTSCSTGGVCRGGQCIIGSSSGTGTGSLNDNCAGGRTGSCTIQGWPAGGTCGADVDGVWGCYANLPAAN